MLVGILCKCVKLNIGYLPVLDLDLNFNYIYIPVH